ncbi:hypothetical protein [Massilia sp. CF038]|uniref:hypothetical protein n=1 Tax=Massilia sp. CF038 TaxID=1881045 RepID=UPI0009247951|nr:hypothetical protein [Massilia sp. CF038]SHG48419.1 hypothetical protein SAMN05428948_0677 [Massilia sp. CF038]
MTFAVRLLALLCAALAVLPAAAAPKQKRLPGHEFAVIGHTFTAGGSEAQREQAVARTRRPGLDFVLVTGIKGSKEPCTDELYTRRRDMLDDPLHPVVVLPAASDWSACRNSAGKSAAIERLNRLRELLYEDQNGHGVVLPTFSRLSTNTRYRSYAENAEWMVGSVLYATINLPADNNHYRPEAGRNSEFEDRAVANRFWLTKLFAQAKRKKATAIVLFSEGDVNILTDEPGILARLGRSQLAMDGYAGVRRQVLGLAKKFNGKVLLIDTAPVPNGTEPAILWKDNIGHVSVGNRTMHVKVMPGAEQLFRLDEL